MPYKNPEDKTAWELRHRRERVARRKKLRQIEAAQRAAASGAAEKDHAGLAWLPFVAGGFLAGYDPKLALAAGGLTVAVAAYYKKSWYWWLVGALTIALALLFLKSETSPQK
jgi:hypothetical protein